MMLCLVASMVMMAQGINGTYFLKNVGTQKFLAAGSYWGTHAIVNEVGLDFILASSNGTVTMDSQVSNGGANNFLNGEYVDGASFGWTFTSTGNGAYTIGNGEKFLTAGSDGLVTLADNAAAANAQWKLVSPADRLASLNAATAENSVDASFLIKGATFSRNDSRNSAWVHSKSGGNETVAGPSAERTSYGCEYWNNTFDISQTLENLPEGIYEFTIAGYGTNGTTYIYANDTEAAFVNTEAAADFGSALDAIAAGSYTGNTTGKVVLLGNTLKIGVKRTENKKQDWAVFDDARLIYYGPVTADEYKADYQETMKAAQDALSAEAYVVVTGAERTALQQVVNEYATVEESADGYKAAILALKDAIASFKDAKDSYDALIAAKTAMEGFDFTTYPYASASRKTAAETSLQAVAVNAADAREKEDAIYKAYRQVAESSAMLEGVDGATDFTAYITNAEATQDIAAPWTVVKGEGSAGSMDIKDNEPWTDGEGSTSHRYFDGGDWAGQAWDVSMTQEVQLPKGRFQLTVKSRAASELTSFVLFAGEARTEMSRIGNGGGLFGRGWNDASVVFELSEPAAVTIGVQGVTSTLHSWMSFSDFRLVSFDKFETPAIGAKAVKVTWVLSDVADLAAAAITGDEASTSLLSTSYAQGNKIATVTALTGTTADAGYEPVAYNPPCAAFTPTTRVEVATAGHDITFGIKPATGHKLKLTRVSFDCVRVGTDGGAVNAAVKIPNGTTQQLSPITIMRNKIDSGNPTGYGHNDFQISDLMVRDAGMQLVFSIYQLNGTDNANPKSMAFRNVVVEGVMDEEVLDVSYFLSDLTCKVKTGVEDASTVSLYDLVKGLKNGQSTRFDSKLYAHPTDFAATLQPALGQGYDVATFYDADSNTLRVNVRSAGVNLLGFTVTFSVTNRPPRGEAQALKRGLMALHQSSGNLVSWRARKSDTRNYKFKLYRGTSAASQTSKVNSGNFIMGKTNFLDSGAAAGNYYKLEVYDDQNQIVETEVSGPTWDGQVKYITLQGGAPTDPTSAKATYTPNDASFCDMDGDGEYDIILKWAPSNEKDAASNGTTSPAFYACYKLDGTRLWMLHTGQNMFNSAHTTPFVAWDLDGDGYGEFMVKTAPGAIDGQGNYVLLGNDDPNEDLKSSRGKQDHGSEYITVFDGITGAELETVRYHTAYGDVSTGFWGDSNQNRSERYLAGIAWLSGENENPSAIFARGYYSGCNIGAYDWDGASLTLRWLHRGTSANAGTVTYADGTVKNLSKSVYGEGAHSFSVGDVTGDGKQEITYGSGALNADGTTLYRTGFGHGDATHLGDFIPSRPGQEFFMVHEKSPYGADLRDARTGEVLWRHTAGGDTGRGLIAHFDSETENAYWQASDNMAMLYDTDQNTIASNVSHGGGASLNNRIYWNETLADDYYDKSVLEYWNPTSKGFWRMQVNGSNYTYGNLNNSSKYNPCVLGDLLGDWREEIVNWQQNDAGDYQLVINATNYQTDYTFPHLMDDYAYRAQLIAQNSVYNQPPHVSYDPRTEKTIVPETFEVDPGTTKAERFWGSFYTTYPVIIPADVQAWSVTNRVVSDNADTLKVSALAVGKIIPAGRAIVFNSKTAAPKFVPTALSSTASVSSTYAKGFYCDSLLTDTDDGKCIYEFRDGDRGPGFYRTYGEKVIPGGNAYAIFGTATQPGSDSYVMGRLYNAFIATGVTTIEEGLRHEDAIYDITGIRLSKEPARGIFIKGGQKYVK